LPGGVEWSNLLYYLDLLFSNSFEVDNNVFTIKYSGTRKVGGKFLDYEKKAYF